MYIVGELNRLTRHLLWNILFLCILCVVIYEVGCVIAVIINPILIQNFMP